MMLHYTDANGMSISREVGKIPVTIGRGSDADIVLSDVRASRIHCRLFYEDGIHYVEDLKSKNGITVNGHKVAKSVVKSGDCLKVGSTAITLKDTNHPGTRTVLNEVQGKMNSGKGYRTIMKEIVDEAAPVRRAKK